MNIDDLWRDIHEMEDEGTDKMPEGGPNKTFYDDMVAVAVMYDEDRDKCRVMQEDFMVNHDYRINIC